jgi:cell division protein FtsN
VLLVKERLTGAIILVALIVLLVPELLTGPIRSAPRAVASSAEEPPLRSYTINLADDAHAHGATQPESAAPQPLAPQPAPASQDSGAASATPAQEEPAPPAVVPPEATAPAPSTPPSSGDAGGGWMIQLGSFASRSNAEHLAHQLKGQGFAASVSQGSTGRHLYRVRVGPVHDRTAAGQLQGKLKAAGHSGSVVPK